jgi:hypothetical protein
VAANNWAHFDPSQIPGWKSLNNERIELWGYGFQGVSTPDGQNILEIDYHSQKIDYIYQDIQTVKGQEYEASFFIRARRGDLLATADETAVFSWNEKSTPFTAEKRDAWTKITMVVVGTGGLDRFGLSESATAGANTSYGPLIDDVRLVSLTCPGTTRSGDKPVVGFLDCLWHFS